MLDLFGFGPIWSISLPKITQLQESEIRPTGRTLLYQIYLEEDEMAQLDKYLGTFCCRHSRKVKYILQTLLSVFCVDIFVFQVLSKVKWIILVLNGTIVLVTRKYNKFYKKFTALSALCLSLNLF